MYKFQIGLALRARPILKLLARLLLELYSTRSNYHYISYVTAACLCLFGYLLLWDKIISLHDKAVICTSRFVYIHQDSYVTSRFAYIHQDSYLCIKICIYTSRFVSLNINQALYVYSKICISVALVGSRPSSCQGGSHLLLGPFPEAFVFCQSVELHQH